MTGLFYVNGGSSTYQDLVLSHYPSHAIFLFTSRVAARSSEAFRWFPCWGDVFLTNFRWFPCWGDDFLFFVCIWLHLTRIRCFIIIKPGFGTITIFKYHQPPIVDTSEPLVQTSLVYFSGWMFNALALSATGKVSIGCLVGMYGVQWGLQAQLLLVST